MFLTGILVTSSGKPEACLNCRGTVQLIVLAYILTPAFALNRWWLTLIYFTILLLISSAEVVSRPSAAYEVCFFVSFHCCSYSSFTAVLSQAALEMQPRPNSSE